MHLELYDTYLEPFLKHIQINHPGEGRFSGHGRHNAQITFGEPLWYWTTPRGIVDPQIRTLWIFTFPLG